MLSQLWDNPIFVRTRQVEERTLGSGARAYIQRYGAGLAILFGPLGLYLLFSTDHWGDPARVLESLGGLLNFSAVLMVLYVTSRALNGTFSAITLEREQKTYDTLVSTNLSGSELLCGKAASGLWPVVRELCLVAPLALGLGALAGYPVEAVAYLALCLACLGFFGATGLAMSYASSSTQHATRRGTALAGFFMLGGPMLDWFLYGLTRGETFTPMATYLSPLAAAISVPSSELWAGSLVLYAVGTVVLWKMLGKMAESARVR